MALSVSTTKSINAKIKRFAWFSSTYIKTIQILLNKCGAKLAVDGIAGYYTINAVYSFQTKYGLLKDGIPGPKTLAKLKAVAGVSATVSPYVTNWSKYPNFRKSEFICGCNRPGRKKYCNGYPHEVYKDLVEFLEDMRAHFTKIKGRETPVHLTSGVRCAKFNADLKGSSPTSAHLYGKAVDFWISYVSTVEILSYCAAQKKAGKIKYYYTNNTNMRGAVHVNI